MTAIPDWLVPIRDGALTITGADLTKWLPPEDGDARPGAVLMLFGEGDRGPDLLLTERAHTMRSHPGQVSFPGGSIDPDDASPTAAALREAQEEVGLDPASVDVLATLPELWLPPSNFAITPVLAWWRENGPVGVVDAAEVHAVFRTPVAELLDPTHRVTVVHPAGFSSPGFLIGDDKDVLLWGFTAGVITKLFDFVGLTRPWDASITRELPAYMLPVRQD
ncbi:MAG: hydrolase [Marmoricola sp.]|nr:hydrolase [Marmoricola sp.]